MLDRLCDVVDTSRRRLEDKMEVKRKYELLLKIYEEVIEFDDLANWMH